MTLKGWICDSCGDLIENARDGWVEWTNYGVDAGGKKIKTDAAGHRGKGLRLVHHRTINPRCAYDERDLRREGLLLSDMDLEHYLGSDGLMDLLSMIAGKAVPAEEALEMIKRLHVPGYEHARLHFDRAIAEGVFEPNMPSGYYWQSDIEAVLRYVNRK